MSEYIDIKAIPGSGRDAKWPYGEWATIPEGQGLEITDLLDGQDPRPAQVTIHITSQRRGLGLKAVVRGDRLWVIRPKKS